MSGSPPTRELSLPLASVSGTDPDGFISKSGRVLTGKQLPMTTDVLPLAPGGGTTTTSERSVRRDHDSNTMAEDPMHSFSGPLFAPQAPDADIITVISLLSLLGLLRPFSRRWRSPLAVAAELPEHGRTTAGRPLLHPPTLLPPGINMKVTDHGQCRDVPCLAVAIRSP